MKEKFHHLTERAKQEARDGDLEECLRLYKQAYKIHKSEKVAKRIEKLKVPYSAIYYAIFGFST